MKSLKCPYCKKPLGTIYGNVPACQRCQRIFYDAFMFADFFEEDENEKKYTSKW